jgi:hypothetical protein
VTDHQHRLCTQAWWTSLLARGWTLLGEDNGKPLLADLLRDPTGVPSSLTDSNLICLLQHTITMNPVAFLQSARPSGQL